MRIGIDFHVADGIYQGVRTYLANLIDEIMRVENELTYYIYVKDPDKFVHGKTYCATYYLKKLPSASGRFNLLVGFPAQAMRDGLSLFHSQYVLPLFLPCKSVLTIHDILFESNPEFFPEFHKRLLKFFLPISARRSHRIISVSEFTKEQIIKYYNIPPEKITVIHEGASKKFSPIRNREFISSRLNRYGIRKQYVLFVGRIEPRKNIRGLLEAFNHVRRRDNRDLCLVIVGNQDRIFQSTELTTHLKDMAFNSHVIFTGGVSEEDLSILYNGAEVLVYPAFAEGFGLPVLEAMACGTPVVTSNTTSLPEIAGDAALLVDPYSTREIGECLGRVLEDPHLRRDLSAKGLERAKKFQWREASVKTIDVYREVLHS
jgi:glycosyltransferase involved in cell wall biosynthesis